MTTQKNIRILDTTLRDGEQAPGCHLTLTDKVEVARRLQTLGVDVIEAGFPASSPAEFEAVNAVARTVGQGEDAPEICGFGRCMEADIDAAWRAVEPAKKRRLHIFIAASDIHLEHKLRMTREQALARAVAGVKWARRYSENVQFSPEDASRADRMYLARLVEAVIDAGASVINVTDTVGYAMPEEFGGLIRWLKETVPNMHKASISVHCHDDLGLAVANALSAVRAGADQVECTVNGVGERAGNAALEEVVMALHTRRDYYGFTTGVNTREIKRASIEVETRMRMPAAANKAIVGQNAFAHASGVHQDGMLKHRSTYEIMKPEDVGVDQSKLVLTARSGRRALLSRLSALGQPVSPERIEEIFRRFKALADTRRYVMDDDLLRLLP